MVFENLHSVFIFFTIIIFSVNRPVKYEFSPWYRLVYTGLALKNQNSHSFYPTIELFDVLHFLLFFTCYIIIKFRSR